MMRLLTGALLVTLISTTGYADETLRVRIANHDWSALLDSLDNDATDLSEFPAQKNFSGLKQDTYDFLAYQFVAIGVLYVMPEGVSGWSDEDKEEFSMAKWRENVSNPTWDKDDYFINYVMHPYWGAGYYVRARDRGYSRGQSFWYSALLSTLYEFGVEALFEQPSIQDLVVTPVGGALLGEYFFSVRRNILTRHARGAEVTRKDRWTLVLTDPLGALNRKTDQLFNRDTAVSVRSFMSTSSISSSSRWRDHRAEDAFASQWTQPTGGRRHRQLSNVSVMGLEVEFRF